MSGRRKKPFAQTGGEVLVRFTPPASGVPRTIGETVDGDKIVVSPNAIRQAKRVCEPKGIRPPFYLWLLSEYMGDSHKIRLRGYAVKVKATRGQIDDFVAKRGDPRLPDYLFEKRFGPKAAIRRRKRSRKADELRRKAQRLA